MGRGKAISAENKISLLKLIQSKKTVLFGQFSSDLDNKEKKIAWKKVLLKAKSLEIVNWDRDEDFVRDKVYGVWKSRTLEKRDNKKQTGSAGGKYKVLNEVDHPILDIIGKDSVTVNGLPVEESGEAFGSISLQQEAEVNGSYKNRASSSASCLNTQARKPSPRRHISKRKIVSEELDSKRKKKQLELMDIKIYKHRLEALKLERDLNLPFSIFTKVLYDEDE